MMKAFRYDTYGRPDVLELGQANRPTVGDDDVLIRVHASSVNPADWFTVTGTPYLIRLMTGLRAPKQPIPGRDVAGIVESVGNNVHTLQPGHRVFAESTGAGAWAEYVAVPQDVVARMPDNLDFEQSATVPLAGITALQAVRDKGKVQAGHRVLVNGASGGVGTFVVQIAKSMGATVTGVCHSTSVDLVRSIGADHTIAYDQNDTIGAKTGGESGYDVVVDLVGNHSAKVLRSAMTAKGTLVLTSGNGGDWFGPMGSILWAMTTGVFASQTVEALSAKPNKSDLVTLRDLLESGDVVPVINRRFDFAETVEALQSQGQGHARGKTVIVLHSS